MSAEVRVNEVGDLLYVRLRDGKIARTDTYGDHRLVDVDAHGSVLGAEFIGVDSEIDLRGLPEAARLRDALLSHAPPSFSVLTEWVSPSIITSERQPVPWFQIDGATGRISSHNQDVSRGTDTDRTERPEPADDSE